MPDFDLDAVRAQQAAARADAAATPDDEPNLDHLTRQQIADCQLCNPHGYTPARRICDHIDHATATIAGRAAVQSELEKIRQRKTNQARGTA